MEIEIKVVCKDSVGDDDDIDEELTSFQYALEELRRYIDCELLVKLNDDCKVYLDVWPDVVICYEDIVDSILRIKNGWEGKGYIWFCEQGVDFYFYYEVEGRGVELTYKKGSGAGQYHGGIPDTTVSISRESYAMEWGMVFKELAELYYKFLGKKITLPF